MTTIPYHMTISKTQLDEYIKIINQFFDGYSWRISWKNITIVSSDIKKELDQFNISDIDNITIYREFWVLTPLLKVLPKMKTVTISEEIRQKLDLQARIAGDPSSYKNENVDQSFDWDLIPEFMTIFQEHYESYHGIDVYIALPSLNRIIYGSKRLSLATDWCGAVPCRLKNIIIRDGKFVKWDCPYMMFDFDHGFVDQNYKPIAKELTDAFNEWTKNGKIGPIFK